MIYEIGAMAGEANYDRPDVLLPTEVEAYVDALKFSNFEELGSLGYVKLRFLFNT